MTELGPSFKQLSLVRNVNHLIPTMSDPETSASLPNELSLLTLEGLYNYASSWGSYVSDSFRRVCSHMLRQGAVPKHVAFIMDGNRRYAKKMKVQTIEGHFKGFKKLEEVGWILGVPGWRNSFD